MRLLPCLLVTLCIQALADCKNKDPHNGKGQRHGTMIYCYGNGGWEEKTYVNGVEHGLSSTFSSAGKKETEVTYVNGKPNGPTKKWHANGKLAMEGTNKDYRQDGVFKEYSEEGHLKLLETYANGELNGEKKTFFDEGKFGKVQAVERYLKGKKHGRWERYFENGKLNEVITYANDEWEGEKAEYDEKGQLRVKEAFKHGKSNGWKLEYYDNSDGYYLDHARYDKDGQSVVLVNFHANGTVSGVTCYDKNGNQGDDNGPCKPYLAELEKIAGKKTVAAADGGGFHENGKAKASCPTKDGKRHGVCKRFNEQGTVTWSGVYDRGVQNGDFSEFFDDGKPKKVSTYRQGKLAKIVEYFDEGQVKKSTDVKDDRELASKEFFQNGNVKEQTEWKGDKQIVRGFHDNGKIAFRGTVVPSTHCYFGCWTSHEYQGTVERFNEDGKLYEKGEWRRGEREGKHQTFYDNGKVAQEEVYDNGRRISEKSYNRKGKLVRSVEYFKDGSKKIKQGS